MRVTVWGRKPAFTPYARLVVRTLDALGYRATLRLLPEQPWAAVVFDDGRRAQTGTQIWIADYPAASNFLLPNFACPGPTSPALDNLSRFCDRSTQRLIDRALRTQQSDTTAAAALWARLDRAVTDQAAAVPLLNPQEVDVTSQRTGDYEYSPQWGVLYDQLWVR
jgi:peptide/nickel transport system substrate-binding protein